MAIRDECRIEDLRTRCFRVPTDAPESDGTLDWDHTTMVLVTVSGGGREGLGYTYASTAAARVVNEQLRDVVLGGDGLAVESHWNGMAAAVRNIGRPGVASMAISAVDTALWDLRAKLFDIPLHRLLGAVRDSVPVYGSGGFTSYGLDRLESQFGQWAEAGIRAVKMKVGRDPPNDPLRVAAARTAIGNDVALYVDANGAYERRQALAMAKHFAASDVVWFEEPVSSDDLEGLRWMREHAPQGMEIAAGEYGFEPHYFSRMLNTGAVDVLQADATRCGGITGFLRAATLAEAQSVRLSSHCAPALHLSVCCARDVVKHMEYFHDHIRIERRFFESPAVPRDGVLQALDQPGLGLILREADAAPFEIK